jgi:hypothetical protein
MIPTTAYTIRVTLTRALVLLDKVAPQATPLDLHGTSARRAWTAIHQAAAQGRCCLPQQVREHPPVLDARRRLDEAMDRTLTSHMPATGAVADLRERLASLMAALDEVLAAAEVSV